MVVCVRFIAVCFVFISFCIASASCQGGEEDCQSGTECDRVDAKFPFPPPTLPPTFPPFPGFVLDNIGEEGDGVKETEDLLDDEKENDVDQMAALSEDDDISSSETENLEEAESEKKTGKILSKLLKGSDKSG